MKTDTFENGFKSGAFWKRSAFLVWIGKNDKCRKSVDMLSFPSAFSAVLGQTIARKRIKKYLFSNEDKQETMIASFSLETN